MILTRSPYYVNIVFVNNFVTHVDFTLKVGTGLTSGVTVIEEYEITKQRPSKSATNTWVDISPYIRDIYDYKTIQTNTYGTATILTNSESLVASIEAKQFDSLGGNLPTFSDEFKCTDGYGYYTEGQNKEGLKKILLSHNSYKSDRNGFFIIPLSCTGISPDPTINGTPIDLNYSAGNTNHVKYLLIPMFNYSEDVTVVFDGETITIELIEECKYPTTEIQFINRFGVLEIIHFYKTAKESINTKSETFKNAYTNGVSYDPSKHQYKQYNKTSKKTIKIETGYLSEEYNETLEELMQSENVWIKGVPINVSSNSLEFKTRIVDKLISYSIDFEYAFDQINNV